VRLLPGNSGSIALVIGVLATTLLRSAPVAAQNSVAELTVVGHGRPSSDTFSYIVGFSDLNLRDKGGRQELVHRVDLAATYVCSKLSEHEVTADPNCRIKTIDETMAKVRLVEHEAQVNRAQPAPGRPWVTPGP
jgi:UrcA family protein